jgi:hypothetical protein
MRVGAGNFIRGESRRIRKGNFRWATIGLRPKHCFSILREAARREIGNAIDTARCSLDPAALNQASQNRICEASLTGMVGRHQTVILLGERYEFTEARAGHNLILPGAAPQCQYLSKMELF